VGRFPIIGLRGFPDDLIGMQNWIATVIIALNHDVARWLFLAFSVLGFFLTFSHVREIVGFSKFFAKDLESQKTKKEEDARLNEKWQPTTQKTLGEAIAKPDFREVLAGLTNTAVPVKLPDDSIPTEEIRISVKLILQEKAKDFRVVLAMDNAQRQALLQHIAETECLLSKLFANQSIAKEFERQWDKYGHIEHTSILSSSLNECASDCAEFLEKRAVMRKDINIDLNQKQVEEIVNIARKQLKPEKIELRNRQAVVSHPDEMDTFKKFDEFASRAKKIGSCDDAVSLRNDAVPATEKHESKYKSEELNCMFKYLCDPNLYEAKNKNDVLNTVYPDGSK
jgi:hypothetical protein